MDYVFVKDSEGYVFKKLESEVSPDEKDYVKPLPTKDFTFRTIKIRISATNERLDEAKRILYDLRDGNEVTFVGAKLNDAFAFVERMTRWFPIA